MAAGPGGGAPWERLGERPGPSGYLEVRTATFRYPDGALADWDLVVGRDVVAVLAVTVAGEVVLARQFRPGPGRVCDELPGGFVDDGESPLEAAQRELREETGYAGETELVGWLLPAATMTRRNFVAVARGCEQVAAPRPEQGEFIEVVLRPLEEFRAGLASAPLTDLGAAYLALDHLGLL